MQSDVLADTPRRYGIVTRCLHWLMATLLLWQFGMLLAWRIFEEGPVLIAVSSFGPYHSTVGMLTLALVVPRLLWAIANRRRRPPKAAGLAGWLVRIVHGAFYILMFLVPALALVRAYGDGKGYALWGLQIVTATRRQIEWLVQPADMLHGPLAWTLVVLVAGHVAMALLHQIRGAGIVARMAGPLRRPSGAHIA